jgi:uncharacterized protein involved in exopolysaccharide biosynthesis
MRDIALIMLGAVVAGFCIGLVQAFFNDVIRLMIR